MPFFDARQPLAVNAALISAFLMGCWAAIKLLTYFRNALIPFVLATMLSGCLEFFVQAFEAMLAKLKPLLKATLLCEFCQNRHRRIARVRREGTGNLTPSMWVALLPRAVQRDLPKDLRRQWHPDERGFCIRLIAVLLTLSLTAMVVFVIGYTIYKSLKDAKWGVYGCGAMQIANATQTLLTGFDLFDLKHHIPEYNSTGWKQEAVTFAAPYVEMIMKQTQNWFTQFITFLLYLLLWLFVPITTTDYVYIVVRTYFMLKTACNTVFGLLVFGLLQFMDVDLAAVIALVCTVLSYIPEVGAVVAMLLPLPFILLDAKEYGENCDEESGGGVALRLQRVLKVFVALVIIKMVIGNGLEPVMMGKNPVLAGVQDGVGSAAETHPVIVLLAVVLMGTVWGPAGMLVSVPLISLIRLAINVAEKEAKKSGSLGEGQRAVEVPEIAPTVS